MSKPAAWKLRLQRIVFVLPLPGADELGQAVEGFGVEAEGLARFACGGASAIGNDVGGHRRAQFAVTLIDVLNCPLALVAAGQVEIDVRPLATLFGEKALEKQVHADRIDGRDAERVADYAIGRRAAPLDQNAFATAELHDVPDDKEVARKSEFGDQGQLALGLLFARGQGVWHLAWADSACECLLRCASPETTAWFRLRARDSRESDSRGRSSGRRAARKAPACWR